MNLSIVIPVMNKHDLTKRCLEYLLNDDVDEVIIVDNGSQPFMSAYLPKDNRFLFVRNETNKGMIASQTQGYNLSTGDIVMFMHNDVFIYDEDWAKKVKATFEDERIGIAGFGGARMLAKGGGRVGFVSNMQGYTRSGGKCGCANEQECKHNAEVHGRRIESAMEFAVVFDGMTLICRRDMLEQFKDKYGSIFDLEYFPHHVYDMDMSCRAADCDWLGVVINVPFDHLGGHTAVFPEYQEWAREFTREKLEHEEGDSYFHKRNHEIFFSKWNDRLPVQIDGGGKITWSS